MKKLSLIGRRTYHYNDNIVINIPVLRHIRGDNFKDETMFWKDVNLFMQTPSDMISELHSVGVDFEELTDYDLFVFLFMTRQKMEDNDCKSLLFHNLDFNKLQVAILEEQNKPVLVDENGQIIIDENIYNDISEIITSITGRQKTKKKKFGNAFAKKKRIEQDYKVKEKMRNRESDDTSVLDGIILRLVCNTNFPYNFETIQDVTIYDLVHSLKQIEKDIQVSDLMQSRLVGNDLTKLPQEQLSRFISF